MLPLKVVASLTSLRILARPMLDVVLRPVLNLLSVHTDSSVAMHAPHVLRSGGDHVSDRDFFPAPLRLTVDFVSCATFAPSHHVVCHGFSCNPYAGKKPPPGTMSTFFVQMKCPM